jgi:cytochrome c2
MLSLRHAPARPECASMKACLWLVSAGLLVACGGAATKPAVLPAQTAAPPSAAEQGKVLFSDKGCRMCHANQHVDGESGIIAVGPNLTTYHNDPAYLRRWLADPKAVKPATQMPNLRLSPDEIDSLIAFLNDTQ